MVGAALGAVTSPGYCEVETISPRIFFSSGTPAILGPPENSYAGFSRDHAHSAPEMEDWPANVDQLLQRRASQRDERIHQLHRLAILAARCKPMTASRPLVERSEDVLFMAAPRNARKIDMRMLRRATPERLSAFSDGVFAVLITVLVLELRPPDLPSFSALLLLWPTWLSYAVSYLFIAIVWTNHHYLMRYATEATPRLLWFNFAHLFSMSLLPFSTAWMAVSKLAPQPVAFYAAVFFLVNATYICLIWELIDRIPGDEVSPTVRRIMRFR